MKTLTVNSKLKNTMYLLIAIGVASFAAALFVSPSRAWHGYIMNYYYFMCLGIGGAFFAATQHLTSAGWSATVRRIPESFFSWLPWAALLILPIVYGAKAVYLWTDSVAVSKDHLLQMKTAYLNVPFFLVRAALFFAVWYLVGGKLVGNSLKQDQSGDVNLTKANVKWSAVFVPLFALLFTFISVDLIMSLDPHWYSTMFGVNCFANLFLSTIAMVIVVVIHLKKAGYFGESVNENHIQNLGLLLFAFTVFYAYIAFCQFMLIWYGNLPEETSYFMKRWDGGWSFVAYLIMATKFFIPFLLLLPRDAKRNMNFLVKMAYLALAANWIDTFWMVMPNYSKSPFLPIFELGIGAGFLGAFGLAVTGFLTKNAVQPQKDPRVHEALHLHQ